MQPIYFLSFLFILIASGNSSQAPWNYNGTTPNLKKIIIGRCEIYQRLILENSKVDSPLAVSIDCFQLWNVFNKTLAFKDPCQINASSYNEFFNFIDNGKDLNDQVCFASRHATLFLRYLASV